MDRKKIILRTEEKDNMAIFRGKFEAWRTTWKEMNDFIGKLTTRWEADACKKEVQKAARSDAERRTHWVRIDDMLICGSCLKSVDKEEAPEAVHYRFCPWCGARMNEKLPAPPPDYFPVDPIENKIRDAMRKAARDDRA